MPDYFGTPDSPIGRGSFVVTPITVTNASQLFSAANEARKYLAVQNNDAVGIVYINVTSGVAATTSHWTIRPLNQLFFENFVPRGSIYMIGSIAANANVVMVVAS